MTDKKLSYLEYTVRAIKKLRNEKSKGIHVVYSSFNDSFRLYFGEEPRPIIEQLVKEHLIESRVVKGGIMIYLPGESPKSYNRDDPQEVVDKILDDGVIHDPPKSFLDEDDKRSVFDIGTIRNKAILEKIEKLKKRPRSQDKDSDITEEENSEALDAFMEALEELESEDKNR